MLQSSAFSISKSVAKLDEEEYGDDTEDADDAPPYSGHGNINISFLPPGVRSIYNDFLDSNHASSDQLKSSSIDIGPVTMAAFDEWLLDFQSSPDEETACQALDTIRTLANCHPEEFRTLANAVRLAVSIDGRIQEAGFWSETLQDRCCWCLHSFRKIFGV